MEGLTNRHRGRPRWKLTPPSARRDDVDIPIAGPLLSTAMSVIAQAIADRQGESARLQAEPLIEVESLPTTLESPEGKDMEDIARIWLKYEEGRILDRLESLDEVNRLALTFASDSAQTFCLLTQMRNPSRNPAGYSLSDAPIVGLLTRVAKLFRVICRFYELRNGEYLFLFSRPLIESAIIATYLLREGDAAVEDFRRCSYKDTLRILRDRESRSEFFRTAPGQRVLQSAIDDLALENLSTESFAQQRRNRWRLQGNSLYDIFAEVASRDEFPFVYGMMSESIHGSWNQSMDWCLSRNADGTFSTRALFVDVDACAILPLVRYATPPYALWLERIRLPDKTLRQTLDRIQSYSRTIYSKFDALYDGPAAEGSASTETE